MTRYNVPNHAESNFSNISVGWMDCTDAALTQNPIIYFSIVNNRNAKDAFVKKD